MRTADLSGVLVLAFTCLSASMAGRASAQGVPTSDVVVSSPLPPLPSGIAGVAVDAPAQNRSAGPMALAPAAVPVGPPMTVLPRSVGFGTAVMPAPPPSAALSAPVPSVAVPAYAPTLTPRLEPFKSIRDAFSRGMKVYNAGDKLDAVRAFAFAASQGHAMSTWKLARMYAEGDGVERDDLKAFDYYSRIADEDTSDGPGSPNARFVASAFVALGAYYLDGIAGTYVKRDPERARGLFEYAATLYGDPDAQYNYARMWAEGIGGPRDMRQAVRWLNLAAEKSHHPSQALLGNILFTGNGVPRQAAQGLMWLSLALQGTDPVKEAWIADLRDKAFAAANDSERQLATLYVDQRVKGR